MTQVLVLGLGPVLEQVPVPVQVLAQVLVLVVTHAVLPAVPLPRCRRPHRLPASPPAHPWAAPRTLKRLHRPQTPQ